MILAWLNQACQDVSFGTLQSLNGHMIMDILLDFVR